MQLAQRVTLRPTDDECTNPSLEILNADWRVYINLPQITIYSCRVTTTKKYLDCRNQQVRNTTNTVHFDATRSCLDVARTNVPNSVTTKYGCTDSGYSMDITEEKTITSSKARVNFNTDQVFASQHTTCRYTSGFCYDARDTLKTYVWDTKLVGNLSCGNLVQLQVEYSRIVEFKLRKKYLVFEGGEKNLAVELEREIGLCGGRAWTNGAGVVVTNDTSFERKGQRRRAGDYLSLGDKQSLYQSLVEECQRAGEAPEFTFCAVVFLLGYVALHLACSLYNRLNDWRTLSRVNGGAKWLFQSWMNNLLVNNSIVVETKLRSDIEMNKLKQEDVRPSYYEYQRPN